MNFVPRNGPGPAAYLSPRDRSVAAEFVASSRRPARFRRLSRRLLVGLVVLTAAWLRADPPETVTVNVRDFGAIGDGAIHTVYQWVESGRYRSLRAIQQDFPFVDSLGWSIDEVAFERAKLALPPLGGTIHFPAGHYVAAKHSWRILRDDVRLTGDGADRTILSTAASVPIALEIAAPRRGGWLEGVRHEYPYTADSGQRGADSVLLKIPRWADTFREGEIVFVRNGANRFDQDYGEFNEIAALDPDGRVHLRQPLARDYTLANLEWAGEVAADFTMPEIHRSVPIQLRRAPGYFRPHTNTTVSVGDNLLRIERSGLVVPHFENPGRGNAARGTVIPAGTKIAVARALIKIPGAVRHFRAEGLQIVGRHLVVSLANCYDAAFVDCTFVRDTRTALLHGGLTVDGDGGRFARFERCRFEGRPAGTVQFARSFGNVSLTDCTLVETDLALMDFAFAGEIARCTFELHGSNEMKDVVAVGRSCGDLEFTGNRIHASDMPTVFASVADVTERIHSGAGHVLVRGNTIDTARVPAVFAPAQPERFQIEANVVTSH